MHMVALEHMVSILEKKVGLDLELLVNRAKRNEKHLLVVQRCIVLPKLPLNSVKRSRMNNKKIRMQKISKTKLITAIMPNLKSLTMTKATLIS